jgi:hypothetical protein
VFTGRREFTRRPVPGVTRETLLDYRRQLPALMISGLLEKLTVAASVKMFPTFDGMQRFNTMLVRTLQLILT